MDQKHFFLMPIISTLLFIGCQSTSKRSAPIQTGQAQTILNKNNFVPNTIDDADNDPEAYSPAFFEQNDLDDATIFSDASNVLGEPELLLESEEIPNPICEDSIYYDSWKTQFDKQWLSEHSKSYKTYKSRIQALNQARSDAYLQLAYSTLDKTSFDFPFVINRQVAAWIDYFTGKGRSHFVVWLRRGQELIPQQSSILERYGLPKDLVYLSMIESGFNNKAVSWVGAVGSWQFMPYTGKLYGLTINDWIDERRDPIKATEAAAKYLTDLYTRFGSWHLAAGAYNCGEGCISRSLRRYGQNKSYFDLSSNGLINRQTADYVPKIIAAMIIAKNPERFGFDTKNHKYNFTSTRVMRVDRSISLTALAEQIDIDPKILADLNPSLRLGITPPRHALSTEGVEILVPASVYGKAYTAMNHLPDASQYRIVQAKIPYRQSIHDFAKRYNFSVAELRRENQNLSKSNFLNRGQIINVPLTLGSGQYNKLLTYKKPPQKRYTKTYKKSSAKRPLKRSSSISHKKSN